MKMEKIRLQKYFTDCGVLSRRAAEREIEAGHVKLNGKIAQIGDKVTPGVDKVVWNGRGIVFKDRVAKRVIALNKPRGYVCTASDEKGRKVVTELVEDAGGRLYPIGRLDMQSEGLLLMTDDGEFANLMMHPKHHIPKEYKVSVKGNVDEKALTILRSALVIDGYKITPAEVEIIDTQKDGARLSFVIFEGRNRQIRKMCEAAGLTVTRLRRIKIGPISVNGIAPGTWRKLRDDEVAWLRRMAKLKPEKVMPEIDE
ncbi:MAG: rRNA pseudouridine synthase [Clostridia bacterium]|nr:rRNA pseudouridine synthase [Clostridia bacterium]